MRRQLSSAVAQSFECELENQVDDPNLLPKVHLDKVKRFNFLVRKYMVLAGGSAIRDQYDALFGKCVLQPPTKEARPLNVQIPKRAKATGGTGGNKVAKAPADGIESKVVESTPTPTPSIEDSSPPVWALVLFVTVFVWGLVLVLLRDYIHRNPSQWLSLLNMDPDETEDNAGQQIVPEPTPLPADQSESGQADTASEAAAVADLVNDTLAASSSAPHLLTEGDGATIPESSSGSLNHPD